ncbi:MAG: PepSY-associated TM helix domain-containing protein [Acidobacteria bacterium]|nr:PepSY-associated TM helix domain-containing protein [Acidobacteriota bacterium]
MTLRQRWLTRPQDIWLRKALFQIHLWTGVAIGLYLAVISLTGAILVFRIELFRRDEDGRNLGDSTFIAWLLDLHDNLLAGETGRAINGVGALLLLVLAVTGVVIWWPGIRTWRRSLFLDPRASWKRLNWNLHSVLGVWFLGFVLLWGVTGAYLSFPQVFYSVADYLEPMDYTTGADRVADEVLYWLAYGHFGRFQRRIPGCGDGCDLALKAAWAGAALVPPAMFITGAIMWWNRVLRRFLR